MRQKLDRKAEKMRFVGYSRHPKGYRLLNESTGRVIIRRDVYSMNLILGKPLQPMWSRIKTQL